jgi:hypothetical protein
VVAEGSEDAVVVVDESVDVVVAPSVLVVVDDEVVLVVVAPVVVEVVVVVLEVVVVLDVVVVGAVVVVVDDVVVVVDDDTDQVTPAGVSLALVANVTRTSHSLSSCVADGGPIVHAIPMRYVSAGMSPGAKTLKSNLGMLTICPGPPVVTAAAVWAFT